MSKKNISEEEFMKIARLARLSMKREQVERLSEKFNEIMGYVGLLDKYDVSNVQPMSHVHGSFNVFREDRMAPSFDPAVVKEIAPDTSGRFIRVPIIVEGGES